MLGSSVRLPFVRQMLGRGRLVATGFVGHIPPDRGDVHGPDWKPFGFGGIWDACVLNVQIKATRNRPKPI
jgi:hypothetical protein